MDTIQSTTMSTKHQTVIPANVRKALGLIAGDKLYWQVMYKGNDPIIIAQPAPHSWAKKTRGLGRDLWKTINIKTYIRTLRNEWEI